MRKLIPFFLLLIFNYSLSIASVRYVSHSGSSTPPYLTWETAADSIMSAINISSFGDTIYVANGVYEEQVVMIPGLSLIGAGMDSCIIDTRQLVDSSSYVSITFADSCLLQGFNIIPYYSSMQARGIRVGGNDRGVIQLNHISDCAIGLIVNNTDTSKHPFFSIYRNTIQDVHIGINLFNSDARVKRNIISTDPNAPPSGVYGILIGGYFYNNKPIIDSNYIVINGAGGVGIYKSFGASPIISNNTILLKPGSGMFLSYSDTVLIYNNLMIGRGYGIDNEGIEHMKAFNNYICGNIIKGIIAGPGDTLENNVITNADLAIEKQFNQPPPTVRYNNLWDNEINYSGFTPADTTSLSVDPMVVNDDTTRGELDFHLQAFSALIDKGNPDILDVDGSRSDMGLYGGPFGEKYSYGDLPPRVPVNLSASVDTDYILLRWNRNYEADFNHYNLYRDTTENFTADSATFVASVEDTSYLHIRPEGINNLYFKLTAVDNQGNVSEPSEELHIVLTGTKSNEEFTIKNYKLFQNYPNPFNPSTRIGYRLKERGYVKLYVYDIKGELVKILVNQYQEGGYHEVEFKGKPTDKSSSLASQLASGVYICQIMVSNEHNIPVFTDIIKMIFIK